MSLQIPHREKGPGATKGATKAVILVSLSVKLLRGGATVNIDMRFLLSRSEAPRAVPGFALCRSMFPRSVLFQKASNAAIRLLPVLFPWRRWKPWSQSPLETGRLCPKNLALFDVAGHPIIWHCLTAIEKVPPSAKFTLSVTTRSPSSAISSKMPPASSPTCPSSTSANTRPSARLAVCITSATPSSRAGPSISSS